MPRCSGPHPDIVRVLSGAFEMASLPNRAELRLKSTGKVIGYTLSLIRDEHDETVGAALLFKDLTHVEQMEERERLRDRLAALGEMAAAMAHEIKNPLGGIEVMAGLLRRQILTTATRRRSSATSSTKPRWRTPLFRKCSTSFGPVRLQLDRASVEDALRVAVTMADGKAMRGNTAVDLRLEDRLPPIQGDQPPTRTGICQPPHQRLRSAQRARRGHSDGPARRWIQPTAPCCRTAISRSRPWSWTSSDTGPGVAPELLDKIFNPFITTKAEGFGPGLGHRAQDCGRA